MTMAPAAATAKFRASNPRRRGVARKIRHAQLALDTETPKPQSPSDKDLRWG
jgi:hypothetical protein